MPSIKPALNPAVVDEIAQRMARLAKLRADRTLIPYPDALREVAGEMSIREKIMAGVHERNQLLGWKALRDSSQFVSTHKTPGEGVRALLGGVQGTAERSRDSIASRIDALHGQYFGRFLAEIEQSGLYHDFKRMDDELQLNLYKELHAKSASSVTGDARAHKLSLIIASLNDEIRARKNRAGAYIEEMPGYITRQTHDMDAIRRAGEGNKQLSFQRWRDFIYPLLDHEKTFMGADPEVFLKLVHEELYSGVYGKSHVNPMTDMPDISNVNTLGSLADKASSMRVLHFKGPEEAFHYNKAFGIKDFREAYLSSIHTDARTIALMERLGPNPRATLTALLRDLQEQARANPLDNGAAVDSLRDWRIGALFNELTGFNEIPQNPSLNRFMSTLKVVTQLAKMGGVVLSSFSDRAFLQAELAYQGLGQLDTFGKQLAKFRPRSPEERRMLRMIGTAMDGIIGNALSRYSSHSTMSGWAHNLQKWFFDLNGLNLWTDASKATAAEIMAANLGDHATFDYAKLPDELKRVLKLYGITDMEWELIRATAYDHGDIGARFITPEQIQKIPLFPIPDSLAGVKVRVGPTGRMRNGLPVMATAFKDPSGKTTHIIVDTALVLEAFKEKAWTKPKVPGVDALPADAFKTVGDWLSFVMAHEEAHVNTKRNPGETAGDYENRINQLGLANMKRHALSVFDLPESQTLFPSEANLLRVRDDLETRLREYFVDRVNTAIPTPGATERMYATWNTQAGTPIGEAVRLIMLFKSFPITIMTKVLGRTVYGQGAESIGQWLLHDRKGLFNMAQLIAMTTVAGYISGAVRDVLKGREPKPLILEDGKLNHAALNDAVLRGGGMGILGDYLVSEYDTSFKSFLKQAGGPVVGQLDALANIKSEVMSGAIGEAAGHTAKLGMDNTPFINLFYLRPILDYLVLWNLQEMMSPGSLMRTEKGAETKFHQDYWMRPSEVVQ